jgi:hypothetical protein
LLQSSCLCVMQDGLPLVAKVMHPSSESLIVVDTPSLQASLMDFHHDTLLRFILENDSISSTSRAHILFLFGQRGRAMVGC